MSKQKKTMIVPNKVSSMTSVVELIREIEKRPAMYISKNYISCLKAFLEGFMMSTELSDAPIMRDFQNWIAEKHRVTTSHSWCEIILFYNSCDESVALEKFFVLFNEFIANEYKTLQQKLRAVIEQFSAKLTPDDRSEISHFLTHGEYEIAFEGMLISLMKQRVEITQAQKLDFLELTQEMKLNEDAVLDANLYRKLKEYEVLADET